MSNPGKKPAPVPPPRILSQSTTSPPQQQQQQPQYNPYGQPYQPSAPLQQQYNLSPQQVSQYGQQPYQPSPPLQQPQQAGQYGQQPYQPSPPLQPSSPQLNRSPVQIGQKSANWQTSSAPQFKNPGSPQQAGQYGQQPYQPSPPLQQPQQAGQYGQQTYQPSPPLQQYNQPPQQAGQYGQQPYQPSPPLQQQQTGQYGQQPYHSSPQQVGQYGQQHSSPQLQKAGQYNTPPQQVGQYGQQPYQPSLPLQSPPQLQKAGEYNTPPPQQAGQYNPYGSQPQVYPNTQSLSQMSYPPQPMAVPVQPMVGAVPIVVLGAIPGMLPPSLGIQGAMAAVQPMMPPATILNNKLYPPAGSTFYLNGTGKSRLRIRIISAQNLVAADANGFSDGYIKLKSACTESFQATKVIERNLNPVWDETLFLEIEDPQKDVLMFDVYDRDAVGCDDFLGFVGIDLSLLPLGIEMVTIENLSSTKHGTIQIGLTAMDFGIANIPPNYQMEYYNWRIGMKPLNQKEYKEIKKDLKAKKLDLGPYVGKITHPDYKFVHGYLKRRKTKREKAGNVGKTAAKVVGYTLLLPVIALANS